MSPRRTRTESTRSGRVGEEEHLVGRHLDAHLARQPRHLARRCRRPPASAASADELLKGGVSGCREHAQPPLGEHHLAARRRQRLSARGPGRPSPSRPRSRPASRVASADAIDAFRSSCATATSSPACRTAAWSAASSEGEVSGGASASVRCASSWASRALFTAARLSAMSAAATALSLRSFASASVTPRPCVARVVLRRVDVVARRLEVDAGLGDVPGRDAVPRGLDRDQALKICVAGLRGIRPRRAQRVELGVGGAERLPALALVPVGHRGGGLAVVATVDRPREEAQAAQRRLELPHVRALCCRAACPGARPARRAGRTPAARRPTSPPCPRRPARPGAAAS